MLDAKESSQLILTRELDNAFAEYSIPVRMCFAFGHWPNSSQLLCESTAVLQRVPAKKFFLPNRPREWTLYFQPGFSNVISRQTICIQS